MLNRIHSRYIVIAAVCLITRQENIDMLWAQNRNNHISLFLLGMIFVLCGFFVVRDTYVPLICYSYFLFGVIPCIGIIGILLDLLHNQLLTSKKLSTLSKSDGLGRTGKSFTGYETSLLNDANIVEISKSILIFEVACQIIVVSLPLSLFLLTFLWLGNREQPLFLPYVAICIACVAMFCILLSVIANMVYAITKQKSAWWTVLLQCFCLGTACYALHLFGKNVI